MAPRSTGIRLPSAPGARSPASAQARSRAAARLRGRFQCPRPLRGQRGGQPGDHRVRGDRPGQSRLGAQDRRIGQAVGAQRDRHGQVRNDLPVRHPADRCKTYQRLGARGRHHEGADYPALPFRAPGATSWGSGVDAVRTDRGRVEALVDGTEGTARGRSPASGALPCGS